MYPDAFLSFWHSISLPVYLSMNLYFLSLDLLKTQMHMHTSLYHSGTSDLLLRLGVSEQLLQLQTQLTPSGEKLMLVILCSLICCLLSDQQCRLYLFQTQKQWASVSSHLTGIFFSNYRIHFSLIFMFSNKNAHVPFQIFPVETLPSPWNMFLLYVIQKNSLSLHKETITFFEWFTEPRGKLGPWNMPSIIDIYYFRALSKLLWGATNSSSNSWLQHCLQKIQIIQVWPASRRNKITTSLWLCKTTTKPHRARNKEW